MLVILQRLLPSVLTSSTNQLRCRARFANAHLSTISGGVLNVLTAWRTVTQFSAEWDWIFASPAKIERKPWSCDQVWRQSQKAAGAAGVGHIPTHSMRHYAESRIMPSRFCHSLNLRLLHVIDSA
jgi:hypothetical protein